MDTDKIMPIVVLSLVIYTWGCLNRGWTSPVDIGVDIACRMGGHRWCGHENAWSDEDEDDEEADGTQMSTPDVQRPPLRAAPPLSEPLEGPRPISQLPASNRIQIDPASQEKHPYETRMAWVRRQIEAGLLTPGEIDHVGSQLFGVDERTVRRWRAQVSGVSLSDLQQAERERTS